MKEWTSWENWLVGLVLAFVLAALPEIIDEHHDVAEPETITLEQKRYDAEQEAEVKHLEAVYESMSDAEKMAGIVYE